jgi:hypothetical protein
MLRNIIKLVNETGKMKLMLAVNNNYFLLKKKLILVNLNNNYIRLIIRDNSLLYYAVAARNLCLITKLIKSGIDIHNKNHSGVTAAEWIFPYYYHLNYSKIYDQLPKNIFLGNLNF